MATIFDTNPDWEKDENGAFHFKGSKKTEAKTVPTQASTTPYKSYEEWRSNDKTPAPYQYGSYSGGSSSSGYSGTTSFSKCNNVHDGTKPVKVGAFELWPNKEANVDKKFIDRMDVLVPLTEFGGSKEVYNDFCGPIMWLPIKDYNVPSKGRLLANCRRINQFAEAGARVGLWCVGSHGRTGLVLATCIALAEPDVDPIDAVRERHCSHCVETQSQIEMVFEAVGRELPEKWKPGKVKDTSPDWVKAGKAWPDALSENETPKHAVWSPSLTCDFCQKPSLAWVERTIATDGAGNPTTVTGTYEKLHWYGQICAHDTCYDTACKAATEKRKAAEDAKAAEKAAAEASTDWRTPEGNNAYSFFAKCEGWEVEFEANRTLWVEDEKPVEKKLYVGTLIAYKYWDQNTQATDVLLLKLNDGIDGSWKFREGYPERWNFGKEKGELTKDFEKIDVPLRDVTRVRPPQKALTPSMLKALVKVETPSNATPTSDSPPAKTVTSETADTIVDQEHFKNAVAAARPFSKNWSVKKQKKFSNLANKVDHFGDIICEKCKLLIVESNNAMVLTHKEHNTRHAVHVDCEQAAVDPDCHPLCVVCYDAPADEDGFCSADCVAAAAQEMVNEVEFD